MSFGKLFDENPSVEFRGRVLNMAEAELAKLRADSVPFWQRRWVMVSAMAAVALAFLPRIFLARRVTSPAVPEDLGLAVAAPEMLENVDILSSMDMLEDLDVLLAWDGKEV